MIFLGFIEYYKLQNDFHTYLYLPAVDIFSRNVNVAIWSSNNKPLYSGGEKFNSFYTFVIL